MPLQLSSEEGQGVLWMGLAGMLTFVIYELGSVFFRQSTDEMQLKVETELLHHRPELLMGFYQLQEFQGYRPQAFRDAVVNADDLLLRAQQIRAGQVQPRMDDIQEAFAMLKTIDRQLGRLARAAERAGKPQDAARVELLHKGLRPELEHWYLTVYRAVRAD